MKNFSEIPADEFTVYAMSEKIEDWSVGCDEMGMPIFDEGVIADNLQMDIF